MILHHHLLTIMVYNVFMNLEKCADIKDLGRRGRIVRVKFYCVMGVQSYQYNLMVSIVCALLKLLNLGGPQINRHNNQTLVI